MTRSYAPTRAAIICLVALSIGPLVLDGNKWRFGQRLFSAAVVAELIACGMAVRDGNQVKAVQR